MPKTLPMLVTTALLVIVAILSLFFKGSDIAHAAPSITVLEPNGTADLVADGDDFATTTWDDPWDMSQPTDLNGFLANMNSSSFQDGVFTANSVAGTPNNYCFFWPLFQGWGEPGEDMYLHGKMGPFNPVDTAYYDRLSFRMYQSSASDISFGWWNTSSQNASGLSMSIPGQAGWKVYSVPLEWLPAMGEMWTNSDVLGFAIFPDRTNGNNQTKVDWIRLTSTPPGEPSFNITWSASDYSGYWVNICADTDNNYANGTYYQIASSQSAASGTYNWKTGVLPPGAYYTHTQLTNGSNSVWSTSSGPLTINTPPTIKITAPSMTSGPDYFANVLGNPKDFSDTSDVTSTHHVVGESFSGGAYHATNANDGSRDPVVYVLGKHDPPNPIIINTSEYYFLSFRMAIDGDFSNAELNPVTGGTGIRFIWHIAGEPVEAFHTSKGIINFDNNYYTYLFDLRNAQTTLSTNTWVGAPVDTLRIDPHEFAAPRGFHLDDLKLCAMEQTGSTYTIQWQDSDPDDNATIAFYYDTDNSGFNGTLIQGGISEDSPTNSLAWNIGSLNPGCYWIYTEISDGKNTNRAYSEAPIYVWGGKPAEPYDFDGDREADISIYRQPNAGWYVNRSTLSMLTKGWGQAGSPDHPVPGDYDGDGRYDIAIFRPANLSWHINQSSNGYVAMGWGAPGDLPAAGDYDGDGTTDIAILRPGNMTWHLRRSTLGYQVVQWGAPGDIPVPADYDGDGKTDVAVLRPSNMTWYISQSQADFKQKQWGAGGDQPFVGDYDGDGKADIAVVRPSNYVWYLDRSSLGFTQVQWGAGGDAPVPADYDGDGKTDIGVWRPSNGMWYLSRSLAGYLATQWGLPYDIPLPGRE